MSIYLRGCNVRISPFALFNNRTQFEGVNTVHKGACISNSYIGYGTYIGEKSNMLNCRIGRYCSIANDVNVISVTHPTIDFVSTSPMFFSTLKQAGKTYVTCNKFNEKLSIEGRNIIIGNDVWIGERVTIKGGIRIGDGAIIAMNACVTKDVPPYAIVGGVPAKILRYRFPEDKVKQLLSIKWWNKSEEWIYKHKDLFANLDVFLQELENENSSCNNSSYI